MNYHEEIDEIGESNTAFEINNTDIEHDLICGLDNDIKTMRNDLNELSDLIEGYETYTPNKMMLNQLKVLHSKLTNGINAIDSGYNAYKDLHE